MSPQPPCTHVLEHRKQPAHPYGPDVVNELVRIRKQLKADGWDYGPRTVHYEAITRLLAGVGHVVSSPKKRPKSSYIPGSSQKRV